MGVVEEVLRLRDEASPALRRTGQEAEKAGDSFEDLDENTRDTERSMATLASSLGPVAAGVGAVTTAAVAAAAALWSMAQSAADLINDIEDMAVRTGLATDTLQGLKLAAEGAGVTLASLESTLAQMPRRMLDAASGTGPAADAFAALGVSVVDAEGNLRSADDVLMDTLASLQGIEDPTLSAALATEALGRSAASLMQSVGDDDLQIFIDRAALFGSNVGPEAAEAAAQWQRSVADLTGAWEGFKVSVGAGVLAPMVDSLRDFVEGLIIIDRVVRSVFGRIAAEVRALVEDFRLMFRVMTGDAGAAGILRQRVEGRGDLFGMDFVRDVARSAWEEAQATTETLFGTRAGAPGGGGGPGGAGGGGAAGAAGALFAGLDPITGTAVDGSVAGLALPALEPLISDDPPRWIEDLQGAAAPAASLLQGDALGALAMAGPVGAGISGGLGALAGIGEMGADGVRENLTMLIEAIKEGLKALPEILIEVLPDFVAALLSAVPEILVHFARLIGEALAEFFRPLGKDNEENLQRMGTFRVFQEAGLVPEFATGGFVDRTGMALVHQGERITAPGGRPTQRASMLEGGGGPAINVTINGFVNQDVVRDMADQLRSILGPNGYGFSLDGV